MSKLRILLVDDHEVVRVGLKTLLNHHPDFEVVAEAATVDQAVAEALTHQPEIVLMDIRLAQGSGIEACARIKKKLPATKVLMVTSYAEDEMLFSAIRAGASGYVLKQVGSNELIRAIEGAARGEVTLDPSLTQRVFGEMRRVLEKEERAAFAELTSQEMKVLEQIVEGKTNRQIAEILYLSQGTIRNYVSNILTKLEVANRAEAAAYAVKHNLSAHLM